jgi:hypothetical protein
MMRVENATEFKLGVKRFGKESMERHEQIVRATALYALRNLVLGTRVDTGRARGNWQVAEGVPPSGDIERLDPAGGQTLAAGSRSIQAASGSRIIWLHNGVPYIEVLEGWDRMLAGTYEATRTWLGARV